MSENSYILQHSLDCIALKFVTVVTNHNRTLQLESWGYWRALAIAAAVFVSKALIFLQHLTKIDSCGMYREAFVTGGHGFKPPLCKCFDMNHEIHKRDPQDSQICGSL